MKEWEAEFAGDVQGSKGRMSADEETEIGILPSTPWGKVVPTRNYLEELQQNPMIREAVPKASTIAGDVEDKMLELKFKFKKAPPPGFEKLDVDNELAALLAYTHDLGLGEKKGNFYFELNAALRKRELAARHNMLQTWGPCVVYLLRALEKLPAVKGVVWRGFPNKAQVLKEYEEGRPIQWGAFSSTSTSFEAAKVFTDQSDGVLLKIKVHSGRVIKDFSFFPCEDEVLISCNSKYIVTSEPYEIDGYTVVDMMERKGNPFIS